MGKKSTVEEQRKFYRRWMMEIAVVITLREFMIDNTEDMRGFFIEIEMKRRRLRYGDDFNEEKNKDKVERIVEQHLAKRGKMISNLDSINYSKTEDDLEDSTVLDFYMNIMNDMLMGTDEETKKGDTVIIRR